MEVLFKLIYAPLVPFVAAPFLALLPAALFGFGAYRHRAKRTKAMLVACITWLLFMANELSIRAQFPPGDPVIRIDMLFVGPAVWVATIAGVVCAIRISNASDSEPKATDSEP